MDDTDDRVATEHSGSNRLRFAVRRLQRHPRYVAAQRALSAVKHFLPNSLRLATHRFRQLPSAVIVGAQKAGTTQLYACLTRHPRVFGGVTKEIQYFSKFADRPLSWYQSQFPLKRTVDRVRGLCVEASPSYLPTPQALRRMREVLPDAAVIVLLRDPVARAFSHYQHYKTRHRESRDFATAIREAVESHAPFPSQGRPLRPDAEPMLDYVARGRYALQIETLWQLYPRRQVLIIDSADLFDDTNAVCQQVFDFLGLERRDVQPTKIYNRGYYRETIDPASAELLREHYRPYDRLLAEMMGRPFRWMERTAETNRASNPLGRNAA